MYASGHEQREEQKRAVLRKVAFETAILPLAKAHFSVGGWVVHVRYCADGSQSGKYKFNVNPNTLTADWELWICGDEARWFLIPVGIMREIYDDPSSYVDRRHPDIRIVSVDVHSKRATYASGGKSCDLAPFFRAAVPAKTA